MPPAKLPTLSWFDVEVHGESFYQDALVRIAGPHTEEGARMDVDAMLYPEANNPRDRNAIRVEIDGSTVGYIPKYMSAAMRVSLANKGITEESGVGADALIMGGRIGQNYGVLLNIALDEDFYAASKALADARDAAETVTAPGPAQPAATGAGGSGLAAGLLVLVALLAIGLVLAYMLR